MIISKMKDELNSMILIQQNFVKILLDYIEKIVSSSSDVDNKYSEDIVKLLDDLKTSLEYCNSNISLIKELLNCQDEDIEKFNEKYLETIHSINKNTLFVEDFLYSLLSFTKLSFSQDKIDEKSKEEEIQDKGIELKENTLIISETTGKVHLPYTVKDLDEIKTKNDEKTYDEIINEFYTLPLDLFKTPFIARFREAFKLAHNKEKKSIKYAFDLATELIFNYNLHPAIITACRNLDELDIYLDYLENNEIDKFDCFKIIFEIPPVLAKGKSSKNRF